MDHFKLLWEFSKRTADKIEDRLFDYYVTVPVQYCPAYKMLFITVAITKPGVCRHCTEAVKYEDFDRLLLKSMIMNTIAQQGS